jgi:hypothetical protein
LQGGHYTYALRSLRPWLASCVFPLRFVRLSDALRWMIAFILLQEQKLPDDIIPAYCAGARDARQVTAADYCCSLETLRNTR